MGEKGEKDKDKREGEKKNTSHSRKKGNRKNRSLFLQRS